MDQKVVIYGLSSDGGSPPTITTRAIVVSQDGFLTANLVLQNSAIFSLNPFSPQFDVDAGVLDMVPVVNFGYLCGPQTGTGGTDIFGRAKYCAGQNLAIIDPTASQMVAELASDGIANHVPAVNTAAQVNVSASANEYVRVTGFGFSITAVNAITVPIQVTLTGDILGSATILFQRRYNVPAGTTVDRWIEGPFGIFQDVRLDVGVPGAGNFVTAEIAAVATGNAPS